MSLYYDNARNRWRISIMMTGPHGRVRKTKMLPAGMSEQEARAIHDKMHIDMTVRGALTVETSGWAEYVESLHADKASWIYKTLAKIRGRVRAKKQTSSITADDLRRLLLESRGRCAVTGIAFQVKAEGRTRPFLHSLDRIDSDRGYVDGNLRIVCYAVNVAMLHWGERVFAEVATGYIINRYCAIGLVSHLRA